jgi:hypothetical protein
MACSGTALPFFTFTRSILMRRVQFFAWTQKSDRYAIGISASPYLALEMCVRKMNACKCVSPSIHISAAINL